MVALPEMVSTPHLISRQVSWLAFNQRVLDRAFDERLSLAERLDALGIAGDNLDGFFMKRAGALRREVELGLPRSEPWPLNAADELAEVRRIVRTMRAEMQRCWAELLRPELARQGVFIVDLPAVRGKQRDWLDRYFEDELFPVLTPLAVDPGRPFPFVRNLSISLAVLVEHRDEAPVFARVKVPSNRPRFVPTGEPNRFVPLEQLIAAHLERLFGQMTIRSAHAFRTTRNADVPRDEAAADDLLDYAVDMVRERRFAPVVRLEIDPGLPDEALQLLIEEFRLPTEDVYPVDGLLGLSDLRTLAAMELSITRRPAWRPAAHPAFGRQRRPPAELFDRIRRGGLIVHHPFESYEATVLRFIEAAADDPRVLGIKLSLYRTCDQEPTFAALMRAADAGKEVAVLIELKARLDEAANIEWARRLAEHGIHTSYGFVGVKIHTHMALVVREEETGLRPYAHLSTGDYNSQTARRYTDIGLFTAHPEICTDVIELFNFLTGYAEMPYLRHIVVAPTDMRQCFLDLIAGEIEHARAGRGGRIVAKMNALADIPLIEALYAAADAGVEIDLIIRGECSLVPGAHDHLRVRSVLGPFLEHSRVFWFRNAGDDKLYLGTADWMYRNLDHRIEQMVPVLDKRLRRKVIRILEVYLKARQGVWRQRRDGSWEQLDGRGFDAQAKLMAAAARQETSTATSSPTIVTG